MALSPLQTDVDIWAQQFDPAYWQPLEILARLAEETGELARELNHRFGAKKKKPTEETAEVADEIADIFFTLMCLANSQQINLDEAWERLMQKVQIRDTPRFQRKLPLPEEETPAPRHLW